MKNVILFGINIYLIFQVLKLRIKNKERSDLEKKLEEKLGKLESNQGLSVNIFFNARY